MSQLNIDNIANQLGTGGPDFVAMPSVGGDPIVESGSNTIGQWTRWANGTQVATRKTTNGIKGYPVSFAYVDSVQVIHQGSGARICTVNNVGLSDATFRTFSPDNILDSDNQVTVWFVVIGRWK